MNIDVFNTHIEVYPYEYGDYPVIENLYTAFDIKDKPYPCGFTIDNNTIYLPRGTSITFLESTLMCKAKYIIEDDTRYPMYGSCDIMVSPRNQVQEQAIDFLVQDKQQLSFQAKTGFGKTICVCYAFTKIKEKVMIITQKEKLQLQWYSTLRNSFRYKESNIMILKGNKILDLLMSDLIEPADVYIVSHTTLHNYLMTHNPYMFHHLFIKLGIGIKVYDEAHEYFENLLYIDFFTNTHRTWYLTATFTRSDKIEAKCFQRAFSSVEAFGLEESKKVMPNHVVYHLRNIHSPITQKQRHALLSYPGFSAAKYGRYAFFEDKDDTAYKEILNIIYECRNIKGKILIFVPLIDNVNLIGDKLNKDVKNKTIGLYHSKITKDEKEEAESKDIIVSTIKSCGTGVDIKGLQVIICCEPIASKLIIEQTIGRLRPLDNGDESHFFDIVDREIPACNWWHRARMFKIKEIVKCCI